MPETNGPVARDVLLVGNLALENAETVMTATADALGRHRRMPDGETGPRSKFITWQVPVLAKAPQFECSRSARNRVGPGQFPPRILTSSPVPRAPEFPPTGYADCAIDPIALFKAEGGRPHRQGRALPGRLPTPLSISRVS